MLELFRQIIPLLDAITFGKGSIGLYDREKYLVVTKGTKISIPLKPGDKLAPGSSSYQVIQNGQQIITEIGPEVLGIPYFAAAFPIKVDDDIIGGLVAAIPTEMSHVSEELQNTASTLSASLLHISAAIQNISSSVQLLAETGQTVTKSSQYIQDKAEETEKVVHYIDSVATNTKLLGLNASIEAARAGESGRGFGVVANEIQKMAVSSAGSARDIRTIIQGMRELIAEMANELTNFGGHTQEVSSAIDEIGASLEKITSTSSHLASLADKL